jgi:hypothetical protein
MSATERRAAVLAQARELHQVLWALAALPEYGEGSCPALALDALDDVIAYLVDSPPGPDDDVEPDKWAKGSGPLRRGPPLRLVGGP